MLLIKKFAACIFAIVRDVLFLLVCVRYCSLISFTDKTIFFNVQTASSALRTVILRLVLLSNVFRLTVVDFFREFYW